METLKPLGLSRICLGNDGSKCGHRDVPAHLDLTAQNSKMYPKTLPRSKVRELGILRAVGRL